MLTFATHAVELFLPNRNAAGGTESTAVTAVDTCGFLITYMRFRLDLELAFRDHVHCHCNLRVKAENSSFKMPSIRCRILTC